MKVVLKVVDSLLEEVLLILMGVVPLVLTADLLMLLIGVFNVEELAEVFGCKFEAAQIPEDLTDPFLSVMNVFFRLRVTENGVSSKV